MAADDRTLGAPVGIGQPNDPVDVRQVQHLLNRHLAAPHGDGHLAEDGIFGSRTQDRLTDYQRDTVRLAHPDAVVDVRGPTMRSLAGALHGGTAATADGRHAGIHDIAAPSPSAHPQRHESVSTQAWIQRVLPAARAIQEKWGVPVSATIAQGAVESQWGTNHPGNNYFGVKGHVPDGSSVRFGTHEEGNGKREAMTATFRAYGSLAESADDYGRFLVTQPRFKAAFEHLDDGRRFVQEVAKAHYASGHAYLESPSRIIDQHDLTRYDHTPTRGVRISSLPADQSVSPQPLAPPGASQDVLRSYWLDLAQKGREAVGMNAASAETQRVASNQMAARAVSDPPTGGDRAMMEDLMIGWKATAERGTEIVRARQQVASTAEPASPSQIPPTRRLRQ